jgi:hypothetical protein
VQVNHGLSRACYAKVALEGFGNGNLNESEERSNLMPGQIGGPSTFDVTKLECFEIDEPGVEIQNNIIDAGEQFYLKATFSGSGLEWENLISGGYECAAQFYAEGMGYGVANLNLGPPEPGDLGTGYVKSKVYTFNTTGIYRCGVAVTIQGAGGGAPWKGALGFNEDCVIMINPKEE